MNNVFNIQQQTKENAEDLQKYLLELDSWEKEMKKKEEELKLIQMTADEEIPPVRNSLYRSKKKNKHKKQKDKDKTVASNKVSIPATDYQAWDKFDADAELVKIEEAKQSSASENSESEDEFYIQKRMQLALLHKDKGNNFFKEGNYDSAVNSYTTGLQLDPENPLLAANRAMAFLKKEQFQAAENDCTMCLSFDPTYVKAYLRRGTARKNLKKFSLAKADFLKVLELEPENKQAQTEVKNLSEVSIPDENNGISDKEVSKVQELWSQILDNKAADPAEESIQEDSITEIKIPKKHQQSPVKPVKSNTENLDKPAVKKMSLLEENLEVVTSKPLLPSVPTTSFEFLTHWNEISSYPDLRYKYLKQFSPAQLTVIFKHYMEPTIFPKILETLSTAFVENGDDVFDYLKYLTEVDRFSFMIMFLSGKEENDLKRLFDYMKSSDREESDLSVLRKKYGTLA